MFLVGDMLQGALRGRDSNGIFGETKEAIIGGCWGLLMSSVFFFFFFLSVLVLFFPVAEYQDFKLGTATLPLIAAMCLSGFLSPVIGILFGLQGGRYSATRHVGCFVVYVAVLLGAMIAITLTL
jgi:hypothetical protein